MYIYTPHTHHSTIHTTHHTKTTYKLNPKPYAPTPLHFTPYTCGLTPLTHSTPYTLDTTTTCPLIRSGVSCATHMYIHVYMYKYIHTCVFCMCVRVCVIFVCATAVLRGSTVGRKCIHETWAGSASNPS